MISQITRVNIPSYATLSQASITLNDMGERSISTQIKIDGDVVPDFSYDWELEFRGHKYIQPLREPQVSKSNDSSRSIVDLVFEHWAIYQLKRYFFVEVATLDNSTLIANEYIFSVNLTIFDFVKYLRQNLEFYYGDKIKIDINVEPTTPYSENMVNWSFSYTHIWDVLTQVNEKYNVRWFLDYDSTNDTYTLFVGYDAPSISHVFEYGYDKGLIKIERQVQDQDIRNQIFGRGGSQNLPYRYFKNVDPNNTAFAADPDWIPELENIYFSELRGKSFRDYVRGWKAKHYGGKPLIPPTEAYRRGYNDEIFSPIEYVQDIDSISKYGLLQGGLDNNEDIYPTIQKRVLGNNLGRADEVVAFEEILVDEPTSNQDSSKEVQDVSEDMVSWYDNAPSDDRLTMTLVTKPFAVSSTQYGRILKDVNVDIVQHVRCREIYSGYNPVTGQNQIFSNKTVQKENPLNVISLTISVIDNKTNSPISDVANIPNGTEFYFVVNAVVSGFLKKQSNLPHPDPSMGALTGTLTPDNTFKIVTSLSTEMEFVSFNGKILGNYVDGVNRISGSTIVVKQGTGRVVLETEQFTIPKSGATNIDVPIRVKTSDTSASYSPETHIDAVNVDTQEVVSPINIPEGTYYLRVITDITNLSNTTQEYTVELMPTYIYYPYDANEWKPTFNIWIKDIWNSTRNDFENDLSYAERIWSPILGDREGNKAKVVFSSGLLSGHSDYDFPIIAFAYDDSKEYEGVKSHWRLTLGKSDADIEATGKWLPSIAIQGNAGDHFYFTGINMPHEYVLWAEAELDKYKTKEMYKLSNVNSTWIIALDKCRINTLESEDVDLLINQLDINRIVKFSDPRFTTQVEQRHVKSLTIAWEEGVIIPNVDIVLSDEELTSKNAIESINTVLSGILVESARIKDDFIRNSSRVEHTFKVVSRNATQAKKMSEQTSQSIEPLSTIAKEASEEAKKASIDVLANEKALFGVQTQVNTLIDEDRGMSVRHIATEVVNTNMPTTIATAMERVALTQSPSFNTYVANRLYDWIVTPTTINISTLSATNYDDFNNVWMIRFGCEANTELNITPTILWEGGIEPTFSTWGICELTFYRTASGLIGSWKVYK